MAMSHNFGNPRWFSNGKWRCLHRLGLVYKTPTTEATDMPSRDERAYRHLDAERHAEEGEHRQRYHQVQLL
jgi:hypothetical protein